MYEQFMNNLDIEKIKLITVCSLTCGYVVNLLAQNLKSKIILDKKFNPEKIHVLNEEELLNYLKNSSNFHFDSIKDHLNKIPDLTNEINRTLSEEEKKNFLLDLVFIEEYSGKKNITCIEQSKFVTSVTNIYNNLLYLEASSHKNMEEEDLRNYLYNEFRPEKFHTSYDSFTIYPNSNTNKAIEKLRKK